VTAAADFEAPRHEASTLQHHDPDFFLHRQVLRLFVRTAPVSVV